MTKARLIRKLIENESNDIMVMLNLETMDEVIAAVEDLLKIISCFEDSIEVFEVRSITDVELNELQKDLEPIILDMNFKNGGMTYDI